MRLSLAVLDLFSGIGGFSLGLERAGMHTIAFCEADPFARSVLRRHWPLVPCYEDVRSLSVQRLSADGVATPRLICGGFPCQDISAAGRGAGLDGPRSRLWFEMLRLVQECRPDWVVVENSPTLRTRGADRVLRGLEAAGYACWPVVVGAVHAGAPHRRQRAFVLAHAESARLEGRLHVAAPPPGPPAAGCGGWAAEPGVGRVVDGLPDGMDRPLSRRARLKTLGNAVVPQVAMAIGKAVVAADRLIHASG